MHQTRRTALLLTLCFTCASASSTETLELAHVLHHQMPIGGAAISPDGRYAATWESRLVRFWDLNSGNIIGEETSGCGSDNPEGTWLSPDGALLAIRCEGVMLIDLRIPAVVARLGGGYYTTSLAFDPQLHRLVRVYNLLDGKSYTSSSKFPNVVEVYDIEDYYDPSWFGSLMRDWFGFDRNVPDESFKVEYGWGDSPKTALLGPGKDQLLLQSEENVELRSVEGKLQARNRKFESETAAWACDKTHVTVVTRQQASMLGRIEEVLRDYKPPKCRLTTDGKKAFMLQKAELSAWDVASGNELWNFSDEPRVFALEITPDEKKIAIADTDGRAAVLSAEGELLARGNATPGLVKSSSSPSLSCSSTIYLSVAMSPDGRTVAITKCAAVFILRAK